MAHTYAHLCAQDEALLNRNPLHANEQERMATKEHRPEAAAQHMVKNPAEVRLDTDEEKQLEDEAILKAIEEEHEAANHAKETPLADTRLNENEAAAAVDSAATATTLDHRAEILQWLSRLPNPAVLFGKLDVNGDTLISREELQKLVDLNALTSGAADWAMFMSDTNGDGQMSFEEMNKLHRKLRDWQHELLLTRTEDETAVVETKLGQSLLQVEHAKERCMEADMTQIATPHKVTPTRSAKEEVIVGDAAAAVTMTKAEEQAEAKTRR